MVKDDNIAIVLGVAVVGLYLYFRKTPNVIQPTNPNLSSTEILGQVLKEQNPALQGKVISGQDDINKFHGTYDDLQGSMQDVITEHVPLGSSMAPNNLGNSTAPPTPEETFGTKRSRIQINEKDII